MKKTFWLLMVTLLAAAVSATFPVSTDSYLIPGVVSMEIDDTKYVEYCVVIVDSNNESSPSEGVGVSVNAVCQDVNGLPGCQLADDKNQTVFSVTPVDLFTDETGCATLELKTEGATGGEFYFSINGEVGGSIVTKETGAAYIPEFTAIGAGLALVGIGIFISKKR